MSNATALRNNVNVTVPRAPALPARLFQFQTAEILTLDGCPFLESAKIGREAALAEMIDSTLTECNAPIMYGISTPIA